MEVEEIDETPSMTEYKRLRKVMTQITKFYRDGSDLKRRNMEGVMEQLNKLDVDERMAKRQLEVLDSTPAFKIHPKAKDYRRPLLAELEGLQKQRELYVTKHQEFQDLFEWSKTIVKICEWLEANLDDYCSKKLDLPAKILQNLQPPRELTPEEVKSYSRGLDEIVYNLQESQDFFAASVDGRLNKYHNVEKALIEAQLEVLLEFPETSERRLYISSELEKDLDYVMGNMAVTPEVEKRRHKMLRSHQEYLHVLRYQREKLQALNVDLTEERKFDSRFDLYRDD